MRLKLWSLRTSYEVNNGVRGNVLIDTPNGLMSEIQLNTPEMIYAKENASVVRKILGDKVYKQPNRTFKGKGGKGYIYYDQYKAAVDSGDHALADAIAQKSKLYYNIFI